MTVAAMEKVVAPPDMEDIAEELRSKATMLIEEADDLTEAAAPPPKEGTENSNDEDNHDKDEDDGNAISGGSG